MLVQHLESTFLRVVPGFAIGVLIATLLGACTGFSRLSRELLDPLLQSLRSIPSMAWVPLFILWLGINENSKIVLIALGVFFPVYLNLMNWSPKRGPKTGRGWAGDRISWGAVECGRLFSQRACLLTWLVFDRDLLLAGCLSSPPRSWGRAVVLVIF